MTDQDKTRAELMEELSAIRRKVSELETAKADGKRIERALRQANERLELALKAGRMKALLKTVRSTLTEE